MGLTPASHLEALRGQSPICLDPQHLAQGLAESLPNKHILKK